MTDQLREIIDKNRVWLCIDCGKCGAVCPISRWESRAFTSPRLLIEKSIQGRLEEVMDDPLFWSCLICKRCTELCPSDVYFTEFLRDARSLARSFDRFGDCTHSEMIQTWSRMMANPHQPQNRLNWLTDDLKISNDSDTLYFVGCLPYYDPLFKKMGAECVTIAQATVKILNHLGVEPQVLADERCCGHDQLWEGDQETFQALASINIEKLQASGAKRIVTACPECARTLKIDYPQFVGDHEMEVLHITEYLAESQNFILKDGGESPKYRVTYQDPCNLGRHLGVYDQPRQVLEKLGFELVEMDRTQNSSLCCGTSCWRACGQVSKAIQVERLKEAKATGAGQLVTACIKCQIHFKCAQNDPILGDEINIDIHDITTLVAERLGLWESPW
jgi:heterodisulfide reductase subunit D